MEKVERPKASDKRIHSKNEFELCYLRHQYFRKTTHNPSLSEMKPYIAIIKKTANDTYNRYRSLFDLIGFYIDDIISIGKFHLVSFLGLFSLNKMSKKLEEFVTECEKRNNKLPNEEQLLRKDKNNFAIFLRQRLEDLIRICKQKSRNVKGLTADSFLVYHGKVKPPKILGNLVDNHMKYGYKKLSISIFKSIRKKANVSSSTKAFIFNNTWYICIPIEKRNLDMIDFSGADLDPYDNFHNKTPEGVLLESQEKTYWEEKKIHFDSQVSSEKARQIRIFIAKYEDKPLYANEIAIAKKWLNKLEI